MRSGARVNAAKPEIYPVSGWLEEVRKSILVLIYEFNVRELRSRVIICACWVESNGSLLIAAIGYSIFETFEGEVSILRVSSIGGVTLDLLQWELILSVGQWSLSFHCKI
jgi:hypothetical protein